jgi:hypothetical protein
MRAVVPDVAPYPRRMLRFHQSACDLLGLAPTVDLDERAAIAERERWLGVRLPAAVVEWYSLRGAMDVLAGATGDRALGAAELGEPSDGWGGGLTPLVRQGLLVIRVEHQGACHWAVRLDDGTDPRVLVEVGSQSNGVIWRLHAASFSDYVFTLAWDRLAFVLPYCLAAQDLPLERRDLALLEQEFAQRQRTWAWPGHTNYRFERGDQRVVIWEGDGQADWSLLAGSAEGLEALGRTLWDCGGLASSLYAPAGEPGSEEVLAALRASLE